MYLCDYADIHFLNIKKKICSIQRIFFQSKKLFSGCIQYTEKFISKIILLKRICKIDSDNFFISYIIFVLFFKNAIKNNTIYFEL